MSGLAEVFSHLSEYARDPRSIGAVAPSSRALAAAMTSIVPHVGRREMIVELGAGTGVITRAIAASWPSNPLVAVEKNGRLAARLRERLPSVEVVHDCVCETLDLLRGNDVRVGAAISGLPMLTFAEEFRARVLAAIHQTLSPRRSTSSSRTSAGPGGDSSRAASGSWPRGAY